MSGTDRRKKLPPLATAAPAVILVSPQLGENIGMVARAMANCGLTDLRLVAPRDGWPNPKAEAAASGATVILEDARIYPDCAAAIADLQFLYATSTRPRGLIKPVAEPRDAAARLRGLERDGVATGILFGPERSGLANDDLALADAVVTVPLNPGFSSLNLAQAVLILGYEWFQTGREAHPPRTVRNGARLAPKAEFLNFMRRLEAQLDETGFLRPPEKRAGMINNLPVACSSPTFRTIGSRSSMREVDLWELLVNRAPDRVSSSVPQISTSGRSAASTSSTSGTTVFRSLHR